MTMVAEQVLQRSDLMGTSVITYDTNKKLGVISQLWVDIDQRKVVALELQNSLISGTIRSVQLINIHWVGDDILVNTEDVVEDITVLGYNPINHKVITETGAVLGKVRDFKFDINSRLIHSLIIGPLVIPWIPTRWITRFELSLEEVVSTGPERLIVFKGAQERLHQLNVGTLERLGFSRLLWKRLEEAHPEESLPTALTAKQVRPQRAGYHEEPEPEEFYDEEEVYEDEYEDEYEEPKQPKYEYVEEEYDVWADKWSDPPDDAPPSSTTIGRRPWGPQPPNPLSKDTLPEPLDPPIP